MPNKLAHFAIEADDVARARKFYEAVFKWRFEPWGPPDFYLIHDAGVHGALQKRGAPIEPEGEGRRSGFECSIAVDDLEATRTAIETAGGQVVSPAIDIPTVGRLFSFADTEGNSAIAIQYEPTRRRELGL